MTDRNRDYSLYLKFAETYATKGYMGIDRSDPLILELERMSEINKQFFHIGDILQMKIFFSSRRIKQMTGIDPDESSPYHIMEATHPSCMDRHNLARAHMFQTAHDLLLAEKGNALMSFNMNIRNPGGGYSDMLFQLYFFYSAVPYKSVFILKVHTLIDWFDKKIPPDFYYLGNDMSYFRYPDEKMLTEGNQASKVVF
jgi:hypothetical protein